MPIRILLGAKVGLVPRNVETLLENGIVEVVGNATDGRSMVDLAAMLCPDVAILDLGLGSEQTLAVARNVLEACPDLGLIVVQGDPSERDLLALFRAGIGGYVMRTRVGEDLGRAIRDVDCGRLFLSPSASHALVQALLEPGRAQSSPRVGGSQSGARQN